MELFKRCPATDGRWVPVGRDRDDLRACVGCKHKCKWLKHNYSLAYRANTLKGDGTK